MTSRAKLFQYCENHVGQRIQNLTTAIKDLENDLAQETKSSAGDKYETSREMLNTEINQLSGHLKQFQHMKKILFRSKQQVFSGKIQLGSLVETSSATYFICIPIGEIQLPKEMVFAIGMTSPIAKAMIGKVKGAKFSFRGETIEILYVK